MIVADVRMTLLCPRMNTPRTALTTAGLVLLAGLLAGCATKTQTAQSEAEKAILSRDPDEVVTVAPATGSNIPKKMKLKDIVSADGTKKSQTQDVDPQAFMDNLRRKTPAEMGRGR